MLALDNASSERYLSPIQQSCNRSNESSEMFTTLILSVKFQALHMLITQGQALFHEEAV